MSTRARLLAASLMLCILGSANAMAPERAVIKPGNSAAATFAVSPHAKLMRFLMQPVDDPDRLRGYRIAILAANGVDGFDLQVPRRFLAERGATVHVIVPRPAKRFQGGSSGSLSPAKTEITVLEPSGERHSVSFDRYIDEVQACEYDIVYLPSNPAFSTELAERVGIAFLRQAAREGKPIFAVGNAALVLLEAGLLDYRLSVGARAMAAGMTSSSASATDEPRVNDGGIHTSRDAFDMPVLMDNLIATLLGRPVKRQ